MTVYRQVNFRPLANETARRQLRPREMSEAKLIGRAERRRKDQWRTTLQRNKKYVLTNAVVAYENSLERDLRDNGRGGFGTLKHRPV